MVKDVLTVSPDAPLEEAILVMRKNNVRVLPVIEDDKLAGIITDKDIFDAFLKISSYGEPGLRVLVAFHSDHSGLLSEVVSFFAEREINIESVMIDRERSDYIVVQFQLMTIDERVVEDMKVKGFDVIHFLITE